MNEQLQLNLGSFILPNSYGNQDYPKDENPVQGLSKKLGIVFDAVLLALAFVSVSLFAKLGI
jgi:hypothetical protein